MSRVPYKWIVATVFVAGVFMDLLDTTSVNVAIPTLSREFDASISDIEWVVTGYLLSLAVWIPASGWIGDRFGTKRVYLFALVVFTVASILCGAATSVTQLTFFRIIQGVGGGLLVPVGTAMLFRAFPPIERAKASTVLTIPVTLAPALGPLIGGWFVTYHSWRWIFYVNVPIGVFAFALGVAGLREHKEPDAGRFDLPGFVLSGLGLASVLFALSRAPSDGWGTPQVVIPTVVGVLAFGLLVWVETHVGDPMLDLRLLKDRMFRISSIVAALSFGTFAGLIFLMPLFLQELVGLNAIETGLVLFPQAIGMVAAAQISGRLYPIVGPRRLVIAGLFGMTAVGFALVFVDVDTNLWVIRGLLFVRGIALAFGVVPLGAATFANIPSRSLGRATAIGATMRQVAAPLGVAIGATVLIEATAHFSTDGGSGGVHVPSVDAFHVAFFAMSCLVLLAAISALFIRDRDVANTMRGYEVLDATDAPPEAALRSE